MGRPLHVFLPVYRDLPSFLRLRREILRVLPAHFEPRFHLLDDTAGEDAGLASLSLPDSEVLTMPRHLGHQGALVFGLRQTLPALPKVAVIATMDADGEDRPEDLPALLAEYLAREHEAPVVLARRTSREEGPLFRVLYFFYRRLFRLLTGTQVLSGNYAVMHRSAIEALLPHPSFDLAYASSLVALGNPSYVPCPRGRRYEGKSRMNLPRLAAHGVRMLLPFAGTIASRSAKAFAALSACSLAAALVMPLLGWGPEWLFVWAVSSFVTAMLSLFFYALLRLQLVELGRIGTGKHASHAARMGPSGGSPSPQERRNTT